MIEILKKNNRKIDLRDARNQNYAPAVFADEI